MQDPPEAVVENLNMTGDSPSTGPGKCSVPATAHYARWLMFLLSAHVAVSPHCRIPCRITSGENVQRRCDCEFASWGNVGHTTAVKPATAMSGPICQNHISELRVHVTCNPTSTMLAGEMKHHTMRGRNIRSHATSYDASVYIAQSTVFKGKTFAKYLYLLYERSRRNGISYRYFSITSFLLINLIDFN